MLTGSSRRTCQIKAEPVEGGEAESGTAGAAEAPAISSVSVQDWLEKSIKPFDHMSFLASRTAVHERFADTFKIKHSVCKPNAQMVAMLRQSGLYSGDGKSPYSTTYNAQTEYASKILKSGLGVFWGVSGV